MILHEPWIGPGYDKGLIGRRLAIVGNSHWHEEGEPDSVDCTRIVVGKVISGEYADIAFFSQIGDYFGARRGGDFWNRVVFFNYAVRSIGTREQKYNSIPSAMKGEAIQRFEAIIAETSPTDVFVFSRSIVWALPPLALKKASYPYAAARSGQLAEGQPLPRIHILRHPQYAPKALMTETVSQMLSAEPQSAQS